MNELRDPRVADAGELGDAAQRQTIFARLADGRFPFGAGLGIALGRGYEASVGVGHGVNILDNRTYGN